MVFRNTHFIALPEYSCKILMCCWRRQAAAVKEILSPWEKDHSYLLPWSKPLLDELVAFWKLLGFPGPLSWARAVGVTWISHTDACTDSWAVEGKQGKQDTSQSSIWEQKQSLSFLTTQSDVKYTSYAWWDLPRLARESMQSHAYQRYLGTFCWYLQRDFGFLTSLEGLNLLMWFLFTASSGGWLWPAQLYCQTQPVPSGPATVENVTKQVTSVFSDVMVGA